MLQVSEGTAFESHSGPIKIHFQCNTTSTWQFSLKFQKPRVKILYRKSVLAVPINMHNVHSIVHVIIKNLVLSPDASIVDWTIIL